MTAILDRQTSLVDSRILETPITVIGAGGIGSFTTLALAKCGFSDITVFDDDIIEEHNIPNQFYPIDVIGHHKVDALCVMVNAMTGVEIIERPQMYTEEDDARGGIVISAVDNMEARQLIYDKHKRAAGTIALIDGRMGGNQLEVYTTRMSNMHQQVAYKNTLWTDEETEQIPCTERAVIYNVLCIASFIVNQVKKVLMDQEFHNTIILDLVSMDMIKGIAKREESAS